METCFAAKCLLYLHTGRIPEGCQTSVKRPVRKPGIALQLYLRAGRIPEGYRKDTGRDEKKPNPDTGLNEFSHILSYALGQKSDPIAL